jgi:hypothetical protein
MALKIQKIENTGVVYADPADPGLSIRFKQVEQGKSLNGLAVANHATEIIINDDNAVTISGQPAVDAISIRLRVSASAQSKARVKALLGILASTNAWADEDVFSGFRPVTTPAVPV